MRTLVLFFTALLTTIGTISIGQTKLIAHKSHSGTVANFVASDYEDNLGLPPSRIEEIIKLNDSTVVVVRSRDMGKKHFEKDTIVCGNAENYAQSVMKNEYTTEVKLVGFDTSKKISKHNKKRKKTQGSFVISTNNKTPPNYIVFILILVSSIVILAIFTWRKNQAKLKIYSS